MLYILWIRFLSYFAFRVSPILQIERTSRKKKEDFNSNHWFWIRNFKIRQVFFCELARTYFGQIKGERSIKKWQWNFWRTIYGFDSHQSSEIQFFKNLKGNALDSKWFKNNSKSSQSMRTKLNSFSCIWMQDFPSRKTFEPQAVKGLVSFSLYEKYKYSIMYWKS